MPARLDYSRAAATYDRARRVPLPALEGWRRALLRYLPGGAAPGPLLDVGCGTGIWLDAFAAWFPFPAIGVEPSPPMRHQARRPVIGGRAEELPVRTGAAGAIWLSTVIHHIALHDAAREARRVLSPGSPVLIRSSFPGRHDGIDLFRFFPEAGRVASTFPSVDATVAAFGAAGFSFVALERVEQPAAASLPEMRGRMPEARLSDTTLAGLTDEEFGAGLARLDAAIARGEEARPIGLDLLVLG